MANEAARARAGAIYLDTTVPGWAEKIDAERLTLDNCDDCVFGQVFDDHYYHVRLRLGLNARQCAELGFCSELWLSRDCVSRASLPAEARAAFREQVSDEYLALRNAWVAEIEARLDVGCVWGSL